jgi:hypothetical protein
VKDGDCGHGRCELATASAVVAEDPPVLQARKRVLHASPAAAVTAPGAIADDPPAVEDGDAKARDTAVPAVGEDAVMFEAECFDLRASEVNGVVAVAGTAGRRGNDAPVAPANERLGIAGPAVVLGLGSAGVVAGGMRVPSTIQRRARGW